MLQSNFIKTAGRFLAGFLAIFLMLSQSAFAQSFAVRGKVVDSKNEPVIGAGVVEKGTNNGAVTDEEGRFSLSVSGKDAVLVITSLGYEAIELPLAGRASVNVVMKDDAELLADAVVVGYGTQMRKTVTGSIASVREKDLISPNAVSVDNLLKGKVAGLSMSQASAQPGASASANIRGALSPNGSNEPLYVIDGVVVSSTNKAAKTGPANLIGYALNDGSDVSPLATINPNDIASVDVLKDASAAAIYGSAAANGVILITTKNGMSGKPKVTYSGSFSVQTINKYYDMMGSAELMEWANLGAKENWLYNNKYFPYGDTPAPTSGWDYIYTAEEIAANSKTDINHVKDATRTGLIHDHNISISGGNDKVRVFSSFNYLNHRGLLKKSSLERFSGRVNLEYDVLKWATLRLNSSYSQVKSNNPSMGHYRENINEANLTNSAMLFLPWQSLYDEQGLPTAPEHAQLNSPAYFLADKDITTTKRLFFTPSLDIKFAPWLKLTVQASVDQTDQQRDTFSPTYAKKVQQTVSNFGGFSNAYNNNYSTEGYLTFDKLIKGKHYLNVVLGGGWYKAAGNSYSMTVMNIPNDALENNALQMSSDAGLTQYASSRFERVKASMFARATYSYDDRYTVSATIRRDGSSVFAKNNKWGWFPGISAGWNIANEAFMDSANWVDFLKLRAGYGASGNDTALYNNYYALNTFGGPTEGVGGFFYFGGTKVNGVYQLIKGNNDLKWETDLTFNVGIDYTFFGGRLQGAVDYYVRTAKDLLDFAILPAPDVMNKYAKNVGSTRSSGVEVSISGTMIKKKDWEWSAYVNLSHNRSHWIERNPDVALAEWQSETDDLTARFGWQTAGIFTSQEDIQNWKSNGEVLQPKAYVGNIKYVDQNGDGKLDKEDIVYLGNADPKVIYGIGTTLRFRNWSLDVNGYGRLGQKRYYGWGYASINPDHHNTSTKAYDRWTSYNTKGTRPGIAADQYSSANASATNDFGLKTVNWLRLSNIKLSYQLPQALLSKAKISALGVYVDLQNTALISNYEGLDPEMETSSAPYPIPLTAVIGVNFSF
ncbi:MAG: SusC/RagA family TonB-linked outer membrane protein [Candidatus Cryptobacteroides sp.]